MKSSPDSRKVLLPTFEEMMSMMPEPFSQTQEGEEGWEGSEAAESPDGVEKGGEDPAPKAAPEVNKEIERVEAICAGLRKQAIAESQQIIEQARQEAVAIAKHTRDQELDRSQKALKQEKQRLRNEVLGAAEALDEAREALYDALEPYFLDTAVSMAESILKYELDRSGQAYASIARNVLEQSFTARNVALHLPPARFDELMAQEGEGPFLAELKRRGVEVQRDPALDDTDCLVTSEMGNIRGGVATQLARIRYAAGNQQGEGQ